MAEEDYIDALPGRPVLYKTLVGAAENFDAAFISP